MKIEKRNGAFVDFDINKIITAIECAMRDTIEGVDNELAQEIAEQIEEELLEDDVIASVESISNRVEELLMESSRKDVAKQYILYRHEQSKHRKPKIEDRLLTDEFISKYKHLPSPMGQLGNFVYYRTYSRWLPEEKRRENWWETVRRAVEYNCSLVPTSREEAQKLYDNIFNLRQFLSGRSFWVGSTDVSKYYPMSNFNCSFVVIDNFNAFKDIFYLLLIGAGVGVRVLKSDVEKLPRVRGDVEIIHKDYKAVSKPLRRESTCLDFNNSIATITVGDSKEGWTQALDFYLKILYSHEYRKINTILFNYDNVRPNGEKLKTFGGSASGHEALKTMFDKIDKVIKKRGDDTYVKLKPIDCLDIANIEGEGVVVGGVRRSAEIVLIDADDEECIQAKSNLYQNINGNWTINQDLVHRQMSNNSIYYTKKPNRERLHWQLEQMRYSGEPGFVNAEAASKRRPNMNGVNPCQPLGEYILTKNGFQKIEKIKDHIVLNGFEFKSAPMFSTGEKEVFEVELENGATIRMTGNHLVSTENGDVELNKLKKNDTVLVDYNPVFKPIVDDIDEYEKGIIAGWFLADGGFAVHHHKDDQKINFCVGHKEFEYAKKLENLITKHYEPNFRLKPHKQKPDTCMVGSIVKKSLVSKFKDELNINGWNKFSLDIDHKGKDFKLGLLRALFTCDGCSSSGAYAILNSTNKDFLKYVQRWLMEFGIYSTITLHNNERNYIAKDNKRRNNRANWKISIYDSDFVSIGYLTNYKQNILKVNYKENSRVIKSKKRALKIKSIKPLGVMPVYDITVDEVHHYNTNGLIVHNCGEILLDSNGLCNLTTVNVFAFVREDGTLDIDGLLEAQRLSARAGYRMTCVELELPHWNNVQQRDKLIGCSLTGWQDMVNATKMSREKQKNLLQKLRSVAREEAEKYAKQLNQNSPLLITTVKPEGTLSQLPTVSSGVHYSHSPYYIRRVRISSNDPLVKVCEELGYPVYTEVGQDWETCSTKVIEFPVKAPEGQTKYDVSAIEQLENYKLFMENYVDHNCSITVHVRNHEWEAVEEWVWENWDDIVAISFLSLDENFYQLLPYESITKEEYEKRVADMRPFLPSLISKYEKEEQDLDVGNDGCESGICPIR